MMQIKCAVVDDEPLAVNLLENYIKKTPFLKLTARCSNAAQLMCGLSALDIDLIFLDIQMPDVSGIELSKQLPPNVRVIFTTAFNQYALDGFRVNALDYLLKPISYADFLSSANKALQWFQMVQNTKSSNEGEEGHEIYVRSARRLIKVDFDKLIYIEASKDYVKFVVEGDAPILSLMSLKALEDMLPLTQFLKVHRSLIVNKQKIHLVENGHIIFNKNSIPVSKSYKKKLMDFLKETHSDKL